ncbi:MAG: TatD family deoxyribonuclease [Erysipelotrichaceae bacterium]|nr:TatD family deoxyribonuclease [Erysipelotrichaceae bacterium]
MIFDTHCHVYDEKYVEGEIEVIKKSIQEGVGLFMVPGDNIINSKKAIELASLFPEVYCAIGVHPSDVESLDIEEVISQLKELYKTSNKIKAIGEIGLDKYWVKDEKIIAKQKEFFIRQIELANELKLPIIIHDRDAHEDTLKILKEHPPLYGGVMHCFSGSVEYLKEILSLGLYIGLDGPVTYKNAITPKEVAKVVPLDRLLVETDSPYLTPVPFRGKINYPHYVKNVIEEICRIKSINSREIENTTCENGKKLFRIE